MLWLPSDWELTGTHVSGEKWAQLVTWTTSRMWKERSLLVEQDSESVYCKKYDISIKDSSPALLFLGYYSVLYLPISIITTGVSVTRWFSLALSSNKCYIPGMLECRKLPLDWRKNAMERFPGNISQPLGSLKCSYVVSSEHCSFQCALNDTALHQTQL